jgi:hypothetical protein
MNSQNHTLLAQWGKLDVGIIQETWIVSCWFGNTPANAMKNPILKKAVFARWFGIRLKHLREALMVRMLPKPSDLKRERDSD